MAELDGQNQTHQSDAGQNQPQRIPQQAGEPRRFSRSLSQLAKEQFGDAFHGEVKDVPAAPLADEPADEPAGEQVDVDASVDADDAPAPEGDDDALQQEAQDADGEGETKASAEGEDGDDGEEASSLHEALESLEVEPEWFQGLKVDVKVNGETSQVPFRELIANYQTNQAAEAKLEQAKTKSAEAQQAFAEKNAALEAQFNMAGAVLQQAEGVLTAEFQQIDWNALHEDDPAEWSAKKVAFQERTQQIEALKQHLMQQYQQSVGQRQHEMMEQQQEYVREQIELLNETMPKVSPDWGSAERAPAAKARLTDYLLKQGFTQEDINTAYDHRLLVIAEKARLHDEAKGKVDVTKKRLRRVPKITKPGTPKDTSQTNQEQVNAIRSRLGKSGDLNDAVALLRAKRKG